VGQAAGGHRGGPNKQLFVSNQQAIARYFTLRLILIKTN
jgi:hypothetical protein